MREITRQVFRRWKEGREHTKCRSIWTDGNAIYSYDTCLLTKYPKGILFNPTRHTTTTSRHQNGIRSLLEEERMIYTEITVPLARKVSAKGLQNEWEVRDYGDGLCLVKGGGW